MIEPRDIAALRRAVAARVDGFDRRALAAAAIDAAAGVYRSDRVSNRAAGWRALDAAATALSTDELVAVHRACVAAGLRGVALVLADAVRRCATRREGWTPRQFIERCLADRTAPARAMQETNG